MNFHKKGDLWRLAGDARELCVDVQKGFDLVLTDPPYNTLERHRSVGTTTRLKLMDNWDCLTHEEILGVFHFLGLVLPPGGYVLFAVDFWSLARMAAIDGVLDKLDDLKGATAPVGDLTGLRWRHPWTWAKTTLSGSHVYGGNGYHGKHCTELIGILQKKGKTHPEVAARLKKALNWMEAPRVKCKREGASPYPTQKPQELGRHLMSIFCPTGGHALDPFAGSGRWLIDPAKSLGLKLTLWDILKANLLITESGNWP